MMRPVIIWYCAAECTTMSPYIERTTQISSAISDWYGKRSEISMPDLPYFLNVRLVPRIRELELTFLYCTSPNSAGRFCPSSLFNRGLGSKVSRCDGPPAMNRKIIDFAGAWPG